MQIRVGIENGNDGRSLVWALDHPGCFFYGKDEDEAILNLPLVFLHYAEWVAGHTNKSWLNTDNLEIKLIEVWKCYFINDAYQVTEDGIEVNAWFHDDWRPLSPEEVERARQLLIWSREDLLQIASSIKPEQYQWHRPQYERWTVGRILQHIANAEWWYLDRLGLAPCEKSGLPSDSFERLALIRLQVMQVLERLTGIEEVVGKEGEFWSPRKFLRRLLYHERDHLGHILELLAENH